MLTAAVIGDLFKPPPIDSILAAIRTFYNPGKGVWVLMKYFETVQQILDAFKNKVKGW